MLSNPKFTPIEPRENNSFPITLNVFYQVKYLYGDIKEFFNNHKP